MSFNVKYPIEFLHTLSVDEVLKALETNAQHGIGSAEAATRTAQFGAKRLYSDKTRFHGGCYPYNGISNFNICKYFFDIGKSFIFLFRFY